jgi:hypothetical protein
MEISSLGSSPWGTGTINGKCPHNQGVSDAPKNIKPNMLHGQPTSMVGPDWTFTPTTRLNPTFATTSSFANPPRGPNCHSHPNLWRQLSHAPPHHLPPTPHHNPFRHLHTIRKRSHWNHHHLYTPHRHLYPHTPPHGHTNRHMPNNSPLSRTPQY